MRTDLYRSPKVCIIADQLIQNGQNVTRNIMRNAVVGALLSTWGIMRHEGYRDGDDLIVTNVHFSTIDDIAELKGLGEQLIAVGWLIDENNSIVFPNFFLENNADPKEKATERQRKYRERKAEEKFKKSSDVTRSASSNVTRNANVTPREEKRRKEITPPLKGSPPLVVSTQDSLNSHAWGDYVAFRREARLKKLTTQGEAKQQAWLCQQGDAEHQAAIVEQSIRNNWQGLFALKTQEGKNATRRNATHPSSAAGRIAMQSEIDAEIIGRGPG